MWNRLEETRCSCHARLYPTRSNQSHAFVARRSGIFCRHSSLGCRFGALSRVYTFGLLRREIETFADIFSVEIYYIFCMWKGKKRNKWKALLLDFSFEEISYIFYLLTRDRGIRCLCGKSDTNSPPIGESVA